MAARFPTQVSGMRSSWRPCGVKMSRWCVWAGWGSATHIAATASCTACAIASVGSSASSLGRSMVQRLASAIASRASFAFATSALSAFNRSAARSAAGPLSNPRLRNSPSISLSCSVIVFSTETSVARVNSSSGWGRWTTRQDAAASGCSITDCTNHHTSRSRAPTLMLARAGHGLVVQR